MIDAARILDALSLIIALNVDEMTMPYKLLFTVLMFCTLFSPAFAQTPLPRDIDQTPISAMAIGEDGTAWTVRSVAPGRTTPDNTVLVSFRSADGKEHALHLRGGRLVLEGEADKMAKGMVKMFGAMIIAEMQQQGVKLAAEPVPASPGTIKPATAHPRKRN